MKKIMLVATLIVVIVMALSAGAVFAGDKNQNGEHGVQGTAKENNQDGCRPAGGDVFVAVNPGTVWLGGACCPSHSEPLVGGYPPSNQCCNPPDYLPFPSSQPGNHCLCFEMRGFTGP
jgi:hypothetical protein